MHLLSLAATLLLLLMAREAAATKTRDTSCDIYLPEGETSACESTGTTTNSDLQECGAHQLLANQLGCWVCVHASSCKHNGAAVGTVVAYTPPSIVGAHARVQADALALNQQQDQGRPSMGIGRMDVPNAFVGVVVLAAVVAVAAVITRSRRRLQHHAFARVSDEDHEEINPFCETALHVIHEMDGHEESEEDDDELEFAGGYEGDDAL